MIDDKYKTEENGYKIKENPKPEPTPTKKIKNWKSWLKWK